MSVPVREDTYYIGDIVRFDTDAVRQFSPSWEPNIEIEYRVVRVTSVRHPNTNKLMGHTQLLEVVPYPCPLSNYLSGAWFERLR